MAKKTNNKELVQVALDSHRWINTPVVYTTFGTNFNRFQQDVMLQVSGHLQDYIKRYLDGARYLQKERPKPIFTSDELARVIPPIHIDLDSLGVGDTHYADIEDSLKSIRELWAKKPVFDEKTGVKTGETWYPVFKKVFVPQRHLDQEGNEFKYKGSDKVLEDGTIEKYVPTRKLGYIEVTINDEVAAWVFDMSQGYFNHLERIAYFCNSAYTTRVYLLLMPYVSRGQMSPLVEYTEVRKRLGMTEPEKKPASDDDGEAPKEQTVSADAEKQDEKYKKFSQFCKQVLDVAKKDMQRVADDNKCEIVFDYEPVYRGTRKRGDPDSIRFKVKLTELGKARWQQMHRYQVEDPAPAHKDAREMEPSLFDEAEMSGVVETPDYPTQILAFLRAAFGNGQQGYDYWFGKRAKASVSDDKQQVVLAVPASVKDSLKASAMLMEKIHRSVAEVMGHACEVLIV